MLIRIMSLAICAALASGCGDSKKKAAESDEGAPASEPAKTDPGPGPDKATPATKPTLTKAMLQEAPTWVSKGEPWEPAYKKLQDKLGAPTFPEVGSPVWAMVDGDTCANFWANRKVEDNTVIIGKYDEYAKATNPEDYNECAANSLGKTLDEDADEDEDKDADEGEGETDEAE